jgi:pyruvate/2-oxoglutarate dehydrogenase complex dihydrolipoamide dehydrogenase (E3) component
MDESAAPQSLLAEIPEVAPLDAYNRSLVASVHPIGWQNPQPAPRYNLVVLGAGTAGLVTAAGAAGLGARVALVERKLLGGDCLNVGCVPSKALLRAARAAAAVRDAPEYGHIPTVVRVHFPTAMERMRRLRAQLSPHDSAARFRSLGVDVFLGNGRFVGPDAVDVAGQTLRFRKAVLATGARAAHPAIPGLAKAGFLTNETIFTLTELPRRLAAIGAGPMGCELAQAFARFGAQVSLIGNQPQILPREDRDAAAIVAARMQRDGVNLLLGFQVQRVERQGADRVLYLEGEKGPTEIRVDAILVGVGRAANLEGMNLEAAGVAYDVRHGVTVNDRLQTTNRRIYAAGDICSRYQFTHAADALARIAIQNALVLGRARASALTIPWCTYTDPEIAHVGLSEKQAQEQGIAIDTFVQPLADVDRAVLDGETEGFVKVHVRQGTDRLVGATVVARHAGEMISELTLALVGGLGLRTLARTIHPYPTQAEAIKKVADAYNRTRLTPLVKGLLTRWFAWTR